MTSRRENRSSSWLTTPLVPSWVLLWLAWLLAAPFPIGITTTGVLILVLWITRTRRDNVSDDSRAVSPADAQDRRR